MLNHELDEVADLLGTTLAYLDANDDQAKAMATSWPHDLGHLMAGQFSPEYFTDRVLKRRAQVSIRPIQTA